MLILTTNRDLFRNRSFGLLPKVLPSRDSDPDLGWGTGICPFIKLGGTPCDSQGGQHLHVIHTMGLTSLHCPTRPSSPVPSSTSRPSSCLGALFSWNPLLFLTFPYQMLSLAVLPECVPVSHSGSLSVVHWSLSAHFCAVNYRILTLCCHFCSVSLSPSRLRALRTGTILFLHYYLLA